MTDCIALIVAAGRGTRAGGAAAGLPPKQYRALAGRSVLRHSLETFSRHPRIAGVRAVIHPQDRALYDTAAEGLDLMPPVDGGATRQDSVRRGLESLADRPPALVLIHDGARPFVERAVLDRMLDALAHAPGAIAAVPVSDTLKRGADGRVAATIERTGLWRAQTPQGFRYADILAAHRQAAGAELSDDAAVAEQAGLAVTLVAGSDDNFKITTEDDLRRAERLTLAAAGETRVGTGFDCAFHTAR
ncbi:MAG: 2-C-methyl-D-erythritol 4-phosphate cytidylyltransferase [Rhodospirillales bacterium]|nr:2-C-methyl-D-erythritol 4-phosphate cytidylyltransferase [Rhodospirillales bacterium]